MLLSENVTHSLFWVKGKKEYITYGYKHTTALILKVDYMGNPRQEILTAILFPEKQIGQTG